MYVDRRTDKQADRQTDGRTESYLKPLTLFAGYKNPDKAFNKGVDVSVYLKQPYYL